MCSHVCVLAVYQLFILLKKVAVTIEQRIETRIATQRSHIDASVHCLGPVVVRSIPLLERILHILESFLFVATLRPVTCRIIGYLAVIVLDSGSCQAIDPRIAFG